MKLLELMYQSCNQLRAKRGKEIPYLFELRHPLELRHAPVLEGNILGILSNLTFIDSYFVTCWQYLILCNVLDSMAHNVSPLHLENYYRCL